MFTTLSPLKNSNVFNSYELLALLLLFYWVGVFRFVMVWIRQSLATRLRL